MKTKEILKIVFLAVVVSPVVCGAEPREADKMQAYRSPIHFMPSKREVGDVMPFYWKGEYHVFYLTNPTGNHDVNWEHTVSKDLVTWKELPPAFTPDKNDPTGPEGGCMFTGCVVEKDGTFHAWYTSWNEMNPAGREYLSHATSKDLIQWTKHPEHMIAPDGVHYANHRNRDFRDPQVFWNEKAKEYWMHILANVPGKKGNRFGLLTSKDLVTWQQQNDVEGVPGDECPDYVSIGDTHYVHSCRRYCYSDRLEGPYKYPELTRELDRPFLNAGKRVWDGKRHVLFAGWAGGPMPSAREVYSGPSGLLYMKPVAEVINVFKHTALDLAGKPEFTQSASQWRYDGTVLRSSAGQEMATAVFKVPEHYMLDCLVTMTPKSRFAIAIGGHYLLSLTPENGSLSLTGPGINRTRPCPVDISKPVKIQVFAEGKLIECFVNDQFAQTCKVGTPKERKLGVSSEGGSVEILKLLVKTCE
jgi:sucrose-6-phosphate hydrolase SacC (GH32 family)